MDIKMRPTIYEVLFELLNYCNIQRNAIFLENVFREIQICPNEFLYCGHHRKKRMPIIKFSHAFVHFIAS